jgi:hypothetical protein
VELVEPAIGLPACFFIPLQRSGLRETKRPFLTALLQIVSPRFLRPNFYRRVDALACAPKEAALCWQPGLSSAISPRAKLSGGEQEAGKLHIRDCEG